MATRNFFVPGIDPDSVSPWPATQADMEVMFRQMYPATDLGMCIQQSSVPNVVTYTELATFLWLKTTTGELHYYDGAGWEKVRAITSVEASDVTGVLDAFTGLGASRVLRRNAANNAYEWVAASSLFSSNSFPVANLVNAAASGYTLISTTGGAWTTEQFSTLWDTRFGLTQLPIIQIYDVDGTSTAGQVLKANGAGNAIAPAWIEDLLRANTTPTSKLNLGGISNAGKYPRVNSTGTDLEFADASSATSSIALLVDTGVQNGTTAFSAAHRMYFGARAENSLRLTGYMQDVAIYLGEVSAAEAYSLGAQRMSPLKVRSAKLVNYWPLNAGENAGNNPDVVSGIAITSGTRSMVQEQTSAYRK